MAMGTSMVSSRSVSNGCRKGTGALCAAVRRCGFSAVQGRTPNSRNVSSKSVTRSSLSLPTATRPRTRTRGRGRGRGRSRRGLDVCANAFGQLTRRLDDTWRKVKGVDELTPENLKEPLKDIRRALLEADVSLTVVRKFIKNVEQKAIGSSVVRGLEPDQALVKVVRDELVSLMGSENEKLTEAGDGKPQVILMLGLQGVGKTTTSAKLANLLKEEEKKSVCLVAADTYRPAAVDQLKKLGTQIDVPVFSVEGSTDPVDVVKKGIEFAKEGSYESIIVDTAGRLQIDADMMSELQNIKTEINPSDAILVVDAMTGQESATLVKTFDEEIGLTGAILSKADGDSRGGAALSMKAVAGKPIKFVSNGEKMKDIEPFYPDRMASRILGMGDVLTLVEKAEDAFKEEEVERLQQRIMSAKFDFNDFMEQMKMMNRMGAMGKTMRLIPGMNQVSDKQMMEAEKSMSKMKEMVELMTEEERSDPDMVAGSEEIQERIAKESGNDLEAVKSMVNQFLAVRKQMVDFSKMMSAKQELAGLVGEDGLQNIQGLPSDIMNQAQVGRKVSKGKVLRKRIKSKTAKPAKGFGKK